MTDDEAKVAPVYSVSATVLVHDVPPFVERKTTMGTGPVSFVLFPLSGYSDPTMIAVPPGRTAPPFE